jgi:CubicO group peptidase (beta-lactamase class C family)
MEPAHSETGDCRVEPPASIFVARLSMSHLVPLLEFNQLGQRSIEMERSPDWVKFVLDRPMSSTPGDAFNYNSGNPHLLSAIITKITAMSALDYAKVKLFGPLGISDVSWAHDPKGISFGFGGLYLEPRDMAKLG